MWGQRKDDVESGRQPLYPMMVESPELRWSFVRKIYSIVSIQLLLTIAVAAVVVTVHPISVFFSTTKVGLVLYILLVITPFIVLCPLYSYYRSHPLNYILLGLFTVSLAFAVGLTCSYTNGKVILEAFVLTGVVVVSLTLYTFWAAKRGHDFNFLGPFLFGAIVILMLFAIILVCGLLLCSITCLQNITRWIGIWIMMWMLILTTFIIRQMFFPMGKISTMIYGCLASIIFCGYIVYDTDNLIKRYGYDEYIWASISLYLDVINLFLSLLTVFRAADS